VRCTYYSEEGGQELFLVVCHSSCVNTSLMINVIMFDFVKKKFSQGKNKLNLA